MSNNDAIKAKIKQILDSREFLKTGTKIVDGEEYRLTDANLLLECIKQDEQELGRMVVEQYYCENKVA